LLKRDLFGALATMNPAGKAILLTGPTDGIGRVVARPARTWWCTAANEAMMSLTRSAEAVAPPTRKPTTTRRGND
jgi:hypothetical protein